MANTTQSNHRMSGYLEKKAKLRLGSSWKKYWFVLEGRLLLYYRSKDEYESLSPCKGSINLCPPCNVKPALAVSCVFQIECRVNTIILRAEDRSHQERWMQALLSAIDQTQSVSNRMSHFRYSLDDLPTANQKRGTLMRQNTMPYRNSPSSKDIIERLQKIGAQTYRVTTGAITMLKKKDHRDEIQKSQSVEQIPQYSIIQEENLTELYSETIANRCVNVENDQYVGTAEVEVANAVEKMNILKENERKVNHVYERISRHSLTDNYSTVDKCKESQHEVINDQYVITSEDGKKDPVLYEQYCAIGNINEDLYEDPDSLKRKDSLDLEPLLPPRPEHRKHSEDAFSQSSSNEDNTKKKKSKFLFRHLKKYDKKLDEEFKKKPKSRSTSFLKRVWKKKTKSQDSQEDTTYEAIDYEVIEKQIQKNKNDLQMLQELQDILESRKNILQEKLKSSALKGPAESKSNRVAETNTKPAHSFTDQITDDDKPILPKKQSTSLKATSHSDSLNNNEIKSIDEILDDLDKEKVASESKQKVKELIDKFEFQNEDDVTMRSKCKPQLHFIIGPESGNRCSEGLNDLLEELSKVTSAPLLKPGVTCSLVTPALTDEEWLKLIPIRSRRLSEPDYDIPRPHRSLQFPNFAKDADNPIPATRFFGPILTSEAEPISISSKTCSIIDPDSLEVDTEITRPDKGVTVPSYVSHSCNNDERVLYAQPKSILIGLPTKDEDHTTNCDTKSSNLSGPIEIKEEEFVDSLEPLIEISTIF